ncbi:Crp/Fnr family transcriptional regulator [Rhodobacteraceae bacterium NNCM2]|nr:Crp/Fnr family transcriptional regulator [Coraliihabitans acroporae]
MTPMLETLSPETRDRLQGLATVHHYETGEEIVSYQDTERDLFIIEEGTVRVTIYSENGKMVDFRTMGPGTMFGEIAVIDGGPRSASVIATEPCRAGRVTARDFWELAQSAPDFNEALLIHLTGLVRNLTTRVLEYSTLHGPRRLVLEILRFAENIGAEDGRVEFDLFPTHQDLAARISSHREAVSRQMSDLVKSGLLVKQGRKIIVPDLGALRKLCAAPE